MKRFVQRLSKSPDEGTTPTETTPFLEKEDEASSAYQQPSSPTDEQRINQAAVRFGGSGAHGITTVGSAGESSEASSAAGSSCPPHPALQASITDSFDWVAYTQWATSDRESYDQSSDSFRKFFDDNSSSSRGGGGRGSGTNHHARLVREIRKRRVRHAHERNQGVPYDQVSYAIWDTPVWHYRNMLRKPWAWSLADQKLERNKEYWFGRCVLLVIGFILSCCGFFISFVAEKINNYKLAYVLSQIETDTTTTTPDLVHAFGIFVGFNILMVVLAFIPVILRPHAAGSGIAEAKAVLNGLVIDKCTDLSTAACKGISVIFSSSASLPVGLEGPLIFIGLSIGEHACEFIPKRFPSLRTERARRDFAAVGTASGVSVAFYSPIGGILFALGEGASFWSQQLLWSCFIAACTTLLVTHFWLAWEHDTIWQPIDFSDFAKFAGLGEVTYAAFPFSFYLQDYLIFILFGVLGGSAGALFNVINKKLTLWRSEHITTKAHKLFEVIVLTSIVSSLIWWLPVVYKKCSSTPQLQSNEGQFIFRQFTCKENEYNELATLFLNNLSTVINLFFHADHSDFSATSCIIAFAVHFIMLSVLFGSSIGMGIFIPLLYIGAAFGRAFGLWTAASSFYQGEFSESVDLVRSFSVVAATGMLGGVTQVLISLVAIMMQATSLSYYVVPFMLVAIFAKRTGQVWGVRGIYDQVLELKGLPFLDEMPPEFIQANSILRARDIMSPPLESIPPEVKVSTLVELLKDNREDSAFQVVAPLHGDVLIGVIDRATLLVLLQHSLLFYSVDDRLSERHRPRALMYDNLVRDYPIVPTIDVVEPGLSEDDLNKYLDVSPYCQMAPACVDGHCSAERAYEKFRTVGLRNLIVLGGPSHTVPIGVIRRTDLALLEEMDCDDREISLRHSSIAFHTNVS